MRVVLDTVILVRGLINPWSPCGRLLFDRADEYVVVVSLPIVAEYVEVIRRPELVRKYHGLEGRDLHAVLGKITNATMVQPEDTPAICRDPADDDFRAAALAGNAGYIVSEDLDLLALQRYEGIAILSAEQFLPVLEEPTRPVE